MEYHLERKIGLSQDGEFKSLYKWFLYEVGPDGAQVGPDQIPWRWTLYFNASEVSLSDSVSIKKETEGTGADKKDVLKVAKEQTIRMKLLPESARRLGRHVRYSMFGTDRTIKDFELRIDKLRDGDTEEPGHVWGLISYTSDFDFRTEITDDALAFYMAVDAQTFDRYAAMIASSQVDEALFMVGWVEGFYSEWSPEVSTDQIKVLTNDDKTQPIDVPDGCTIVPPRLGKIGEAKLYLKRKHAIAKVADHDTYGVDDELEIEKLEPAPSPTQNVVSYSDPRLVSLLSSTRTAAWAIAGILVAVAIFK